MGVLEAPLSLPGRGAPALSRAPLPPPSRPSSSPQPGLPIFASLVARHCGRKRVFN